MRFAIKPSRSKISENTSGANNLSKASKTSNCMNLYIHLLIKTRPEDNIKDDGQSSSSNMLKIFPAGLSAQVFKLTILQEMSTRL